MRPHGRAQISATRPRALGICQRCGFKYNHDQLQWQYQYGATRLINLRILVCPTCYDQPQIQLRTILLPPDPVPIEYPVPENYADADNPYSGIGYSARANFGTSDQLYGAFTGTLTQQGGLAAAFDGYPTKSVARAARVEPAIAGLNNFIGVDWNAPLDNTNQPSVLVTQNSYSVSSFKLYASTDATLAAALGGNVFDPAVYDGAVFDIGPATYAGYPADVQLQGSNNGVSWTVLYSTTSAATVGEVITSISSNLTTGNYRQHRIAIGGSNVGSDFIAVAQLQLNVADTGQNEQ